MYVCMILCCLLFGPTSPFSFPGIPHLAFTRLTCNARMAVRAGVNVLHIPVARSGHLGPGEHGFCCPKMKLPVVGWSCHSSHKYLNKLLWCPLLSTSLQFLHAFWLDNKKKSWFKCVNCQAKTKITVGNFWLGGLSCFQRLFQSLTWWLIMSGEFSELTNHTSCPKHFGGRFPFSNYPCEVKFLQHQALTHFGWQSGMACPDKNTPTPSNGSSGHMLWLQWL